MLGWTDARDSGVDSMIRNWDAIGSDEGSAAAFDPRWTRMPSSCGGGNPLHYVSRLCSPFPPGLHPGKATPYSLVLHPELICATFTYKDVGTQTSALLAFCGGAFAAEVDDKRRTPIFYASTRLGLHALLGAEKTDVNAKDATGRDAAAFRIVETLPLEKEAHDIAVKDQVRGNLQLWLPLAPVVALA